MILKNISLKPYNTFGLDYKADCLVSIKTEQEAIVFFRDRESCGEPLLIMGEGSNLLFISDFRGTVLHNGIEGINPEENDESDVILSVGAGVKWDRFVEWSVKKGYYGVENLSLIPGLVGAAPVQNIGAYGMEVKDTITKVRAIDIDNGSVREFTNEECQFSYRNSIFKKDLKNKFFITKVYFRLGIIPSFNLQYDLLETEVNKVGATSLRNVRQAVINIRKRKLPDPKVYGNAGSFFKNPVLSIPDAEKIIAKYPLIPHYPDDSGGIKLAAGWLIDRCGWKGKRIGNAGVHEKQALVLVNYGNATGKEIYELSEKIKQSVLDKYGITLEPEVEIIGST
jgi:UDP-N-acetylmuramate dehydrogenase